MKRCKACGREFRSGSRVLLVPDHVNVIACANCVAGGVTIVARRVGETVDTAKAEKRSIDEALKPFRTSLETKLKAYKATIATSPSNDVIQARIEAIEDVLGMMKEGRA